MSKFDEIKDESAAQFQRKIGIEQTKFIVVLEKVRDYIETDHKRNPRKTRGQKASICIEDKLLLTMHYLRNYPTFTNLGAMFDISESYANKIYHYILKILIKVQELDNRKNLLDQVDTIVIDVCEQPLERPKKGPKKYYSGKKTTYHKAAIDNMPNVITNPFSNIGKRFSS